MIFTVSVCGVTALLVLLSVLFKPDVKIGNYKFGTYWIISLVGALILLLGKSLTLTQFFEGLTADSSVNPLKILVLFFSMTALSVYLDVLGFFRYLANVVLSKAAGSQKTLFLLLYITVSVLTVFTSNDIIILTFTPFICFFSKKAKINPLPYLFGEFVAANTWSMMFIIGNPTNIYLASSADISFIDYFKVMALPTAFAGLVSFIVLRLVFTKQLNKTISVSREYDKIQDKTLVGIGIFHIALCTVFMVISSYINLPMWIIALGFCVSLFLCVIAVCLKRGKKPNVLYRTIVRLPFELVPFLLSMFAIVLSLEGCGATKIIGEALQKGNTLFSFGFASLFSANVINNIPMSVLFSSVINNSLITESEYLKAVYSCIAGSNIGAYLTPVGALAGIMWSSILKLYGINFSFKDFIKNGFVVAIPVIIATLLGLEIIL